MKEYKNRSDVPEKYKWDLTDFYENDLQWEQDFKLFQEQTNKLSEYKGLMSDSNKLYEYLELYFDTFRIFENLYVYAFLINDQELGIESSIKRKNKIENSFGEFNKNTCFFDKEILNIDNDRYIELFNENEKLTKYKFYLDKIYRDKAHILNESEEKIITDLVNSMDHFESISSNILNSEHNYGKVNIDGKNITIATNNYSKLLKNPDLKVRKKVYSKFNKVLDQYGVTMSELLNSFVSSSNALSKIKKFDNTWDQKMFNTNLTTNIFESLKKSINNNLDSVHKYFDLKKDVLNVNKLHMYDIYLPLSSSKKEYSIEQSQEIILKSLEPLGEEYLNKFKKIFDNRYIDYCQYKGKCSGAYSASSLDKPSRILMSYNSELYSMSVIVHEGGHNVNHQFIEENNDLPYRYISLFVAEVASLTNECLLSHYLSENGKDKSEKLSGIENLLNVIEGNLFDAVREGQIEQNMYKLIEDGGTITKEFMDKQTLKSLRKFMGPSVMICKKDKNGWQRRSHYYNCFYLFSYSICMSVALNVSYKILNNEDDMLNKYMKFLKTGSTVWPIDAFKILGIDLEDENTYLYAIKCFDNLIEKYREIYNS